MRKVSSVIHELVGAFLNPASLGETFFAFVVLTLLLKEPIWVFFIMLCIVLKQLGKALAFIHLGLGVSRIGLSARAGGVCVPKKAAFSRFADAFSEGMLLIGVILQFFVFLFLASILPVFSSEAILIAIILLVLGFSSCWPLYGLAGSRIVKSCLFSLSFTLGMIFVVVQFGALVWFCFTPKLGLINLVLNVMLLINMIEEIREEKQLFRLFKPMSGSEIVWIVASYLSSFAVLYYLFDYFIGFQWAVAALAGFSLFPYLVVIFVVWLTIDKNIKFFSALKK